MSTKIVIAGGGTGGHVYPALSIGEGLLATGLTSKDILFIGSKHSIEKDVIPQAGFRLKTVPGKGLNKSELLKNIWHLIQLKISTLIVIYAFIKDRPKLVIGVGGYASVPALFAATLLGIKRIVHEQNSYMGRTNYLAQLAGAKVLTTFENTVKANRKAFHVGLPLRSSFETAINDRKEFCSKKHDRLRVAITGGSLGSKAINDAVVEFVEGMGDMNVDIVHVCGKIHYENVKASYISLGDPENVILHSYREDLNIIFSRSDLVIARAGAGTCVELETLNVESVLIPLPSAPNDQQRLNAEHLVEKELSIIVNQEDLSGKFLHEIIEDKVKNFAGGERDYEPYRYHLEASHRIAEYIQENYLDSK